MKALLQSERGAIMVIALFMAIFATGCLHYLAGIAAAIAQRERMQDAADAAAFSAAVLHARGMNTIALINMTMAALLAVLIALRLIELVSYASALISTGLAFVTYGASLPIAAAFTNVGLLATEGYEEAQPVVHATLRALRIASRGVRVAIPWVAQARTVATVVGHYDPPVRFGFSIPGRLTLPTRDGTYGDLCTKAGEYVGDLVELTIDPINVIGLPISGAMSQVVDAGSSYFCETENVEPPSITTKRDVDQPQLPKVAECERYAQSDEPDPAEHAAVCAEAAAETFAANAALHPRTGECVEGPGSDCGGDGLYELRATLALSACAPRSPSEESAFRDFWWQERRFKRRYVWDRDEREWLVAESFVPGSERLYLWKDVPRPCGTARATMGEAWNTERWRDGERVAICDNIVPPSEPPHVGSDEVEIWHSEVLEIFRCIEVVHERQKLEGGGGDLAASDDGSDMAPQLIADGAVLGDEDFQVRAVVVGNLSSKSPVAMLSHLRSAESEGNQDEMATWEPARQLASLGVAQAEFYFDETGADPERYLWAMHWTARLRRFHLFDGEPAPRSSDDESDASKNDVEHVAGSLQDACAVAAAVTGGFACDEIDLEAFADIVAH